MKIKKITLKNFRQFKDMMLEFSTDPAKNVTVILAENSTGKTTLMQSIKWCLYGDSETDLDNLNELINFSVIDSSIHDREELWVELVINKDGVDYTVKRTKEIHVNSGRKASETIRLEYKKIDGETIILEGDSDNINPEVKKIKRMINKILTKDMANYFLFDGERIDNLGRNDSQSRQDIKEAINAINDFTIINNAIDSLKSLSRQYNRSISNDSNDEELKNITSKINQDEDEIISLEENIKKLSKKIHIDNEKVESLDQELNQYENIEEFVKRRKKIERELSRDNKRLSESKSIIKEYYSYRKSALIFLLNKKYKKVEFNRKFENNTVPGMENKAIDHIIKNGRCICGENLTASHIEILKEQKEYQPPLSPADLINNFDRLVAEKSQGINKQIKIIKNEINNYINLQETIADKKEELAELSDKIDESNLENIKEKNMLRKDFKKKINSNNGQLAFFDLQLEEINKNLAEMIHQREIKLAENEQNRISQIKLDLINNTLDMLTETNERYRKNKKSEIESVANKHFSEIIYKEKQIVINDDFEYQVLETNKKLASPSEGERIAISMSLVLAIIEVHKNKKNQPKNLKNVKSSGVEFSLVLDAAFAKLDTQFSRRISEKLPLSVEQIILFSTKKQYKGSVETGLENYVGKKYKLEISEDSNMLTNDELTLLEANI